MPLLRATPGQRLPSPWGWLAGPDRERVAVVDPPAGADLAAAIIDGAASIAVETPGLVVLARTATTVLRGRTA